MSSLTMFGMPVVHLPATTEHGRFCVVTLHDLSGAVARVACVDREGAVRFFPLAEAQSADCEIPGFLPVRLDADTAEHMVGMLVSTGLVPAGRVAVAEVTG